MAGIGRRCTLPLIMQDGLIAEQRGRQDRDVSGIPAVRRSSSPVLGYGLGQQVAAHTGQQSELPEFGRKAQHCRGFLPLKLRGRGQDDVGRAFSCR